MVNYIHQGTLSSSSASCV